MSTPIPANWDDQETPAVADGAGMAAAAMTAGKPWQQKAQAEIARDRLHQRTVGSLPLNPERARFETTEEARVLRNSRPRNRRWKPLAKLDLVVDNLTAKLAEASADAAAAEQRVREAPQRDASTLAAWLAAGQRGQRPESSLYEAEREVGAAKLVTEAIQLQLDEALARRVE
jgi:hypothetical protein